MFPSCERAQNSKDPNFKSQKFACSGIPRKASGKNSRFVCSLQAKFITHFVLINA